MLFAEDSESRKKSDEKALSTLESSSVKALSPPKLATGVKTEDDAERTTGLVLYGVGNLEESWVFPLTIILCRRVASCSSKAMDAVEW